MPTYRIGLTQQVWEEATIYIEANSEAEAEELAHGKAMQGDVEWQFMDSNGEINVVSVELAPVAAALPCG